MFDEQLASQTASRWLDRAVGKRREAKPNPGGSTVKPSLFTYKVVFVFDVGDLI